jgi:xanthine dehydrogenase large subunit
VLAVVTAADIPGDPILAAFAHDEPILAQDTVQYAGQVLGLVVARDVTTARAAARAVQARIDPWPAVLDARAAHAQRQYVLPPVHVRRGDAAAAIAQAPHRLTGSFAVGGQEHYYLEGQVALAIPQEQDQWMVLSSTQHPGEVQHWVAHALGLANHQCGWSADAWAAASVARKRRPATSRSGRAGRAQGGRTGQTAAASRRRHPHHRQAPSVCLRLRRRLRR